jgi:Lrp/AsnC family transcriptional regulator of ectoine degradation
MVDFMSVLKLDRRDIQILSVLSREGRISKAELAKRVNLSATPCWERLKRLEKSGVIRGYHADVALKRIAKHVVVFVVVELESHRKESFQAFERAVERYDEITDCWAVGGGFDYLMQIVTRDVDSYQRLIDELLAQRLGLSRYFTYVVTKPVKGSGTVPFNVLLGPSEQQE